MFLELLAAPITDSAWDLADEAWWRLPDLDTDQVLAGLAEIALASGRCPDTASELIHQASLGFGYAEESWADIKHGLGLGNTAKSRQTNVAAMPVDEAYRELELEIGATASEAKVAYRQLMKKYHPDALAEQPRLLEMATELSKRIEAAYRVVLRDIADRTASTDQ